MNKYLAGALLAMTIYAVLSTRTCNAERQHSAAIESNAGAKDDTLHYLQLKTGQQLATIAAQEGTIAEIKATAAATIQDREQKLDLKAKQLEGAQDLVVQLQIKFSDTVKKLHHGDTIGVVDHHEQYNDFHETIRQDSTTGRTTVDVTDTPTVPLHLTEYTAKITLWKELTHPLQQPKHYVGAYSDNCNARVTGLESVLIVKEHPKTLSTLEAVGIGLLGGLLLHNIVH